MQLFLAYIIDFNIVVMLFVREAAIVRKASLAITLATVSINLLVLFVELLPKEIITPFFSVTPRWFDNGHVAHSFDALSVLALLFLVAAKYKHLGASDASEVTSQSDHGATEDLDIWNVTDNTFLVVKGNISVFSGPGMEQVQFLHLLNIQRSNSTNRLFWCIVLAWWLYQLRFTELGRVTFCLLLHIFNKVIRLQAQCLMNSLLLAQCCLAFNLFNPILSLRSIMSLLLVHVSTSFFGAIGQFMWLSRFEDLIFYVFFLFFAKIVLSLLVLMEVVAAATECEHIHELGFETFASIVFVEAALWLCSRFQALIFKRLFNRLHLDHDWRTSIF